MMLAKCQQVIPHSLDSLWLFFTWMPAYVKHAVMHVGKVVFLHGDLYAAMDAWWSLYSYLSAAMEDDGQ